MSTVVDERVVSMQFDNKQFERGVATSMSTLEKLKQSLNLSGAVKGMEEISKTAKGVDLSPINKGVEVVVDKFNYASVMIKRVFENIVDSAYITGKRIASAFTIDPIKTGLAEYETQINAVQTILANTQSKGTTLDNVNAALDELNTYADKTIYNFTEMTRNIGTFTAAGVELDTSVSAIKGIANLAAVSGSTSQQASTAMYQLSQALAAGTVKLMDWNSVVNAGMGGQVFQDSLKETARNHGIAIDSMIAKEGSFRETLQNGWLTSDILLETLNKFTGDLNAEQLKAMGYTEEQIDGILKLGKTANDAATKVKTFTQLMDTLKEAAQSGWTQTWEILIGDFEEAKELWTMVSDVFGKFINDSAQQRNELLQGWKDSGGRIQLIESLKNAFTGVINLISPIKDAFKEIFPPITVKQLVSFTENLQTMTERFKELSVEYAPKIKKTFLGVFSVIDIGVTVIKELAIGIVKLLGNFKGLGGGILDVTGSIGSWLSGMRDSVKETNIIGTCIGNVVTFLQRAIDKFKEFTGILKEKIALPGLESLQAILGMIWTSIKKIGKMISDIGSEIGKAFVNIFRNGDLNAGLELLNGGLLASILLGVKKFVGGLSDAFDDATGLLENIKGILDGVQGSLEAWQQNLKAGTLMKIAGAIGILTASLVVMAMIDPVKLTSSLGAITVLFADLMGSMAVFDKIGFAGKNAVKATAIMIGISTSVLILAAALKQVADIKTESLFTAVLGIVTLTTTIVLAATAMSMNEGKIMKGSTSLIVFAGAIKILASVCKDLADLDWNQLAKGLTGVGVLMAEISAFMFAAKFGNSTIQSATSIVILAGALKILASVCGVFGEMDTTSLIKGVTAIGILLAELALFTTATGNSKKLISTGVGMIALSAAMKILASAIKDMSSLSYGELLKGLLGMATALSAIVLALNFMPKNMVGIGAGLVVTASSLLILAEVIKKIGGMNTADIVKGVTALGISLGLLAVNLNLMRGTLAASAALLVAAGALAVLAPVLKTLGSMKAIDIAKSLITIAGALAIIGGAGVLLGPVVPAMLALSGAIALFGVGCLAAGVGVAAFSAALATLTTVGTVGATAIVAALSIIVTGIVSLIPAIAAEIGKAIVVLVGVLVKSVPTLVDGLLTLIVESLKALTTHIPTIIDLLYELFVKALDSFANVLPGLIKSAVNLIGAFFTGVVEALGSLDMDNLIKGVLGIGLMSGLMVALGAVTSLIPSAMVGVVGMGVVIAELALVLAAIGALSKIPGLKWLIDEGGKFLESVGTAIGSFVGGIVGGFMGGVSSQFPKIGEDLAKFMKNVKPFIDGAKQIDSKVASGVKALATTILTLTAADVLNGLTSWFTGGSSLADFGKEIAEFGPHLKSFADSVKGVDGNAIKNAAKAAKTLAEMADTVPNKGGVAAWFAGENSLASFGSEIVSFGKNLKSYANNISGINTAAVQASTVAAKTLSELANTIPNKGGIAAWFAGDNSIAAFGSEIVSFGRDLKKYSDAVTGINVAAVAASATASASIVALSKNIPENKLFKNETTLDEFGKQVSKFGGHLGKYFESVSDINTSQLSSVITQVNRLVSMAKGMVGLDTSGMKSFGKDLGTLGQNGIKAFIKAFTDAHPKITTAAKNIINTFIKGAKSMTPNFTKTFTTLLQTTLTNINGMKEKFYTVGKTLMVRFNSGITSEATLTYSTIIVIINKALSAIKNEYSTFTSVGQTLMAKFTNGMSSKSNTVASTAAKMVSKAVSAVRDYYGNFYEAGKYVVAGFAAGISANTYKAEAKSREMAKAAKRAAEKELDEHSPSKEFYRIGAYAGEGFVNALDDYATDSFDAATNFANSAKKGLTKAISKIVDIVEGNVDVHPTIRPVLDLSDVESGTRKLNAMFSHNQAMAISAGIRKASTEEIQNGVNTPVGNTFQFTQNNYSPKALSRVDIYRQTKNQFSAMERMVHA
ncbi:MAG: tape measure protein [Bacteroidales bacterium]|nr:tape measure protein [Bacteroidales bacterium]